MSRNPLFMAVYIGTHLAYMVLVPLFIFGGLGLYFDHQADTLPRYLLIGIALAFACTIFWMSKRFREIIELAFSKKKP